MSDERPPIPALVHDKACRRLARLAAITAKAIERNSVVDAIDPVDEDERIQQVLDGGSPIQSDSSFSVSNRDIIKYLESDSRDSTIAQLIIENAVTRMRGVDYRSGEPIGDMSIPGERYFEHQYLHVLIRALRDVQNRRVSKHEIPTEQVGQLASIVAISAISHASIEIENEMVYQCRVDEIEWAEIAPAWGAKSKQNVNSRLKRRIGTDAIEDLDVIRLRQQSHQWPIMGNL